jgi:hypothetical protein
MTNLFERKVMKNLHEKLQYIQTQLKVPKGQRNKFGNYNYRSLEDIVEAVKPLLAELGAYILMSDQIVQIGERYYVQARAVLSDGVNEIAVLAFAREPLSRKGMDESQITGAASSYARKYAMNGLLAIDDIKDSDATNKHEDGNSAKDTKPKATKQQKGNEILDLAWLQFEAKYQSILTEESFIHFEFDFDMFKKAIIKQFKALPTNKASIKLIIEKIKPENCLKEKKNDD